MYVQYSGEYTPTTEDVACRGSCNYGSKYVNITENENSKQNNSNFFC